MSARLVLICIAAAAGCIGTVVLAALKPHVVIKNATVPIYWLPAFGFAYLLLQSGLLDIKDAGVGLISDGSAGPLKILAIFLAVTLISIFLDETGFFRFSANWISKKCGTGQIITFTTFYVTVSVLAIFTSNDVVVLTFTPFICHFAKNAGTDPIPYVFAEFVAANTTSMLLNIGNPTNLYLSSAVGIPFVPYLKVMAVPTLFAVITEYVVLLLVFYKQLKSPVPVKAEAEEVTVVKIELICGLVALAVCTALVAASSYMAIEMWIVAVTSVAALFLVDLIVCAIQRKKPVLLMGALNRTPWEVIPFILSMFIIVLALNDCGAPSAIAGLLGVRATVFTYGFVSVVAANLINNIPMSVLFSSVLRNADESVIAKGVYATAIGANVGAFLTPVGSLAGIMWLRILTDHGLSFRFLRFLACGTTVALPTVASALGALLLVRDFVT